MNIYKLSFVTFFLALFAMQTQVLGQDLLNIEGPHNTQVNMRSGNFFYQRSDLFIGDQALPIDVTYSFNTSLDTINYGYGNGWVFSYAMNYQLDSLDNVIISRVAGRRDTFKINGPNYDAPLNVFDELEKYDGDKYRLTNKYGLVHLFEDPSHRSMTQLLDNKSNTITFNYQDGFLSNLQHSNGRALDFSWENGLLVQMDDNNGPGTRSFQYVYDDGNLVEVIDPMGFSEKYNYDDRNNLIEILDKNETPLVIKYSSNQKVRKLLTCFGEESFTFSENKSFRIIQEEGVPMTTKYEFNDVGLLVKLTNPSNQDMLFEYDDEGNMTKFTDLNGNANSSLYDGNGNKVKQTDPNGFANLRSYTSTNRLQSETDRNGNTTFYEYDSDDNISKITHPDGTFQTMLYDSYGNITSLTNERDETYLMTYNSFGNITSLSYPIGGETYEYDSRGNMTKVINAVGEEMTMSYDMRNRIASLEDNLGRVRNYTYDGNGNVISETNLNGVVHNYSYDPMNRLVGVSIDGHTTSFEHNHVGNLKFIKDAKGAVSNFEYDERGLLTAESDQMGYTWTYQYDANGNILTKTTPTGIDISYERNNLDRITSKSFEDNTESFTYDKSGRLTYAANDDINISYAYDSRNRLISKTINNWNKTIFYSYDAKGNRTSMTDPDGSVTNYTYDAFSRLISMSNSFGNTSFQYNTAGRLTRQDNPNGTYVTFAYNLIGQLTLLTNYASDNSIISSSAYTYDNQGNRLSKTNHDGLMEAYFYDNLNRLDSIIYSDGSYEVMVFDEVGNRVERTTNNVSEQYLYNNANFLLSVNDTTFSYDESGNLISKSQDGIITEYKYNAENRLVEIIHPSGAFTSYKYDPFGNKISMIDSSGNELRYLHDFQNVLLELDNNGNTQTLFSSSLNPDGWLAMRQSGVNYFYHKDGLGSITELSISNESIAKSYVYDAFGNIINETGAVPNRYTYTGREKEIDSDLYYYRSRFYDPAVGRFTSKDGFFGHLGVPSTLHKYTYAENNPTSYVDFNGEAIWIPVIVGAAAGFAIFELVFAHSDAHTQRNCYNQLPNTADPASEGWEQSPDDYYHQPDPDNPTNSKWLKPNSSGPGSSEAILQPDGTYDTSSEYLGTYNYYHPTGMQFPYVTPGNVGHAIYDVLPHIINPNYEECDDDDDDPDDDDDDGDEFDIPRLHAVDPNEISGPLGYDTAQWVSINDNLGYTVFYENDPDFATAPAQVVKINVPVHPNLNIYSVRLSDFGFGSFNFSVPENTTFYQERLDVRDSLNVFVDITAGIDVLKNEIFWILESIDPETNLPPEDALTGFLPVNDTTVTLYNDTIPKQGEGYVNYTIRPQTTLMTGDTVQAQASIIFDLNAALLTNVWTNLIDAFAPTSEMDTIIPYLVSEDFVELSWGGIDDTGGVGIDYYNLFMSKDSSPYLLIAEKIDTTVYLFEGDPGSEYFFYTRAVDHVGNVEDEKYLLDEKVKFGDEAGTITILQPTIAPNEYFCENDSITIEWESTGSVDKVDVLLSEDGGVTFPIVIALDTSMINGPIVFPLTGLTGSEYVIKIEDQGISNVESLTEMFTVYASSSLYCTTVLSCEATVLQNVSCNGGSDGIIKLEFPYNQGVVYFVSPDLGTQYSDGTIADLPAGNYTITVVNDDDVTEVCNTINITEPEAISCELECNGCNDNTVYVSAPGEADAIISINTTGGDGAYFYQISPSMGTDLDNGLYTDMPVGIYTIQVTDGQGCVQECITVHVAELIDATYVCTSPSNGALTDADVCLDEFITLYANPVVNEFRLKGLLEDYFINILNSDGTLYQDISSLKTYDIIDLNNLPSGLYFISILHKTNNQVSMQKIIKY